MLNVKTRSIIVLHVYKLQNSKSCDKIMFTVVQNLVQVYNSCRLPQMQQVQRGQGTASALSIVVIFCLRIVQPAILQRTTDDNGTVVMAQQKLCKAIYEITKFPKHVWEQPAFPSHFLSRRSIFNRPTRSVGLFNQIPKDNDFFYM